MGAEQLMTAKINEFAAHLTAGDRSAAERARTEAIDCSAGSSPGPDGSTDHADFRLTTNANCDRKMSIYA